MEALVRALLEGGVSYATGYPGGPASVDKVLLPVLEAAGPDCGLRFEWSVNEAVLAAKVLGRTTLTNARSFGFMKNIGLNVASDAFFSMAIKSTYNSGALFLVAADPQPHRSQTSQDNRYILSSVHVPLLEPGSPQEVLDLARDALELSERYRFPFFMHMNPLILESEGAVKLGDIPGPSKAGKKFVRKERMDFVTISYQYSQDVSRRLRQLDELAAKTADQWVDLNRLPKAKEVGIVSSGFFAPLIEKAQAECRTDFPVLRLKAAWPSYAEQLSLFLAKLSGVLVLEEGRPFLEHRIAALANSCNPGLPVWGKRDGLTTEGAGTITEEMVVRALKFLKAPDKAPTPPFEQTRKPWGRKANEEFFPVYLALRRIYETPDQWHERDFPLIVVTGTGDFGSYAIPQGWVDFKFHMGSSFPIAGGLAEATVAEQDGVSGEDPVVVTLTGDCSLFHSDFQGLVDNIQYQKPVLHIICDNKGSGMTGGQEIVGQDIGKMVASMDIHFEQAGMEDVVALSGVFTRLLEFVRKERRPALLHVRA
jgi:indolepyruvate ferredoxin oxidoreductase alpha subunit